jgi:mannose-6-phosphate isomerase-like protein (cupin superfamily)
MMIHGATRAWSAEQEQKYCFSKNLVTSVETEAMSAHHLRIEPGGEYKSHAHERETELHFVISGRGQALIGDQWEDLAAGDVTVAFPGIVHGLRNPSSDPLFVLCIFSPPLV